MKSSSESIGLAVVSGVGGACVCVWAEASRLLDRVAVLTDDNDASAFLFLGWEEMVSSIGARQRTTRS